MPSIKLTYFNIEVVAEKARLALVMTDTPFEDNRIAREKWAELKATTPFGQIPILEITEDDGTTKTFAQSGAMLRYVARRFDKTNTLLPVDADQMMDVEEMACLADDFWREMQPLMFMNNGAQKKLAYSPDWSEEEKKTAMGVLIKAISEEQVPKFMAFLTKKLEKTGGFLCSAENVTAADLCWLPHYRFLKNRGFGLLPEGMLEGHDAVNAWADKMQQVPQIKKWYGL